MSWHMGQDIALERLRSDVWICSVVFWCSCKDGIVIVSFIVFLFILCTGNFWFDL